MMTTTKRRLTVSLDRDEIEAIETICEHQGSPSRSAAVRKAIREMAAQVRKRQDRASRLPQAAPELTTEGESMTADAEDKVASHAFLTALAMTIVKLDEREPEDKTMAKFMAQLDVDMAMVVAVFEDAGPEITDRVNQMREGFADMVQKVKLGKTPTNTRPM